MILRVPAVDGMGVVLVDQQPLLAPTCRTTSDEREVAAELLAVQIEVQIALP